MRLLVHKAAITTTEKLFNVLQCIITTPCSTYVFVGWFPCISPAVAICAVAQGSFISFKYKLLLSVTATALEEQRVNAGAKP